MREKPELLAPAGNLEKLKFACVYGADAVYLGGKNYSLRAMGGNFTAEEMTEGVRFAHRLGKKVYVTVNIFPHNEDLKNLPEYLAYLAEIEVDALLVADLGVMRLAKQYAPTIPLHISTQANITNIESVEAWKDLGASRVVLARELSQEEIKYISENSSLETEIFVHGAMCISYSGRCLLSSYMAGRDSNRGACVQPCRFKYVLEEEKRPKQFFPIVEDEGGTYILNSKDLCLLPYLPQVIDSGAKSLKIEGRMKSVHYVATVTAVYRSAIDSFFDRPQDFCVREKWLREITKVSHRPYTSGFFLHKPKADAQVYGTGSYEQSANFVGIVQGYDEASGLATAEQRGLMRLGDELEILSPTGKTFKQKLEYMADESGVPIERAPHAQQMVKLRLKEKVPEYAILRV